jgi:16S rRNA (cytidine1402-2'-O)-methyltransferase
MTNTNKSPLYIVATPIGNLKDITLRALEILTNADIILAEDTRETGKLLASLAIRSKQKLVSCHDFNEEHRVEQVKEFLDEGLNVALVSDAGTPLISDPGYKVVSSLRKGDYQIIPIPGVSAVITALSAAGIPSDSFMFKGFLPAKKNKRQEALSSFKNLNTTLVLYESVYRILFLIDDICEILPDADIVVAKELTKQFENFVGGKPNIVKEYFDNNPDKVRGEFVVLISCSNIENKSASEINEELLLTRLVEELPIKKAVKIVTELLGLKRNDIYEKALQIKQNMDN